MTMFFLIYVATYIQIYQLTPIQNITYYYLFLHDVYYLCLCIKAKKNQHFKIPKKGNNIVGNKIKNTYNFGAKNLKNVLEI